jgi:hypothetical protein
MRSNGACLAKNTSWAAFIAVKVFPSLMAQGFIILEIVVKEGDMNFCMPQTGRIVSLPTGA